MYKLPWSVPWESWECLFLTQGCACGYRFSLQVTFDLSSALLLRIWCKIIPCHTSRLKKLGIRCLWLPEEKVRRAESTYRISALESSQAFAAAASYRKAGDFGAYCLEGLAKLQDECRDALLLRVKAPWGRKMPWMTGQATTHAAVSNGLSLG